MNFRALIAAVATGVLSLLMVESAHAQYPTTTRSGTSTVTGVYRPLDLNLQFAPDPIDTLSPSSTFFYTPSTIAGQTFALTALLTGTFGSTGSTYGSSGTAGNWTLNLGFNSFNTSNNIGTLAVNAPILAPIVEDQVFDRSDGNTIFLRAIGPNRPVGSLVYNGGLSVTDGDQLPEGDRPNVGDVFLLYSPSAGDVFRVTVDNLASPENFYLALLKDLVHLGPYVDIGQNTPVGQVPGLGARVYGLDDGTPDGDGTGGVTRINADCETGTGRCGGVPSAQFFFSSVPGDVVRDVPEPTSVILVGLGLVGLALARRRRDPA